jgi:hypothetical protein
MRKVRLVESLVACSLAWSSCIYDLTPDVGPLIAHGNEPVNDGDAGRKWQKPLADAGTDAELDAGFWDDPGSTQGMDAGTPADGAVVLADGQMPDPPVHDSGPHCTVKDSNPSKDVSFKDDVWPILEICRCHSSEDDEQFGILEGGLTIDNYATLRAGGDHTGANIIVPGNACDSVMLQKLSENPPFGNRMPNMGPYLSVTQRTILADWIIEGAKNN